MYSLPVILCILCFVATIEPIIVKMIPEYLWDGHLGGNFTELCGMPCLLLENSSNPDAELFTIGGNTDIINAMNRHSNVSLRIVACGEAGHFQSLAEIQFLKTHFEATALVDWTSDVPWPMMLNMDDLKAIEMPKNPAAKATFVARNCNPTNNRMMYVKLIDHAIGVVALSSCYHNTDWPRCDGGECDKTYVIRPYKLNLAFENGDSPKYVTEKIYHAFAAGVLPVYMGTRDIATAVPKGSYIDVADFDTPEDLVLYLKEVLANETLYQSYFEWKNKPFDKEFDDRFRGIWSNPFRCRICRFVDAYKKGLEWDIVKQVAKKTRVNHKSETRMLDFTSQLACFIVPLFFIAVILYHKKSIIMRLIGVS